LLERTVEHIVNPIIIFVYTVYEAALKIFQKKEASKNGEM